MRGPDLDPGDAAGRHRPPTNLPEDDAWVEGRSLIANRRGISRLIDPSLFRASACLSNRLFHEHGVRVFKSAAVEAKCSCSRDSVTNMLKSFLRRRDRDEMVQDRRDLGGPANSATANMCFAPRRGSDAKEKELKNRSDPGGP